MTERVIAAPAPDRPGLPHRCGGVSCRHRARTDGSQLRRQRAEEPRATAVPPVVDEALRSPSQPLDAATRAFFEPRFGYDFGRVRVHADAQAASAARAIDALAYTVGSQIVFDGESAPLGTPRGRHVLAHELAHVAQHGRAGDAAALRLGAPDTAQEQAAHAAAAAIARGAAGRAALAVPAPAPGTVQRFSTQEHIAIGEGAYARANPRDQGSSGAAGEPTLDPAFVAQLRTYRLARGRNAPMTYGQLVAAADEVASLALLEEQDRERQGGGIRVPVLSYIWDKIGDTSHYLDLASRNLKHFHPHNFLAWQSWQWTALRTMNEARALLDEARAARTSRKTLLQTFDRLSARGRVAIEERDRLGSDEAGRARDRELEETIDGVTRQMSALVTELQEQHQLAETKTREAVSRAQRAVTINGFGNHFLTDAFAAGHIVTPRRDLIEGYSTRLLGVLPVGGVLHCANIPSLAWHDLDNKFGVLVNNRDNEEWVTYGDNFADTDPERDAKLKDSKPDPKSLSATMEHAVGATAISLQQLWAAAAGRPPSSLAPVLNKLPRPVLDKYPRWQPEQWELQLRYAAGEQVGADYGALGRTSAADRPREEVPNPSGEQIGAGVLSARATCVNLLSTFGYDQFVVPMLGRIRTEYAERFYVGSAAQTVSPDAVPEPQESVVGHVAVGSLVGGLGGALLGFALGGPLGAVIGGIVGLLGGGLVGGLLGRRRRRDEPAV